MASGRFRQDIRIATFTIEDPTLSNMFQRMERGEMIDKRSAMGVGQLYEIFHREISPG